MLAVSVICPEAALTPQEYSAISVPLQRILERLPKSTLDYAASWADPCILIYGVCIWLIRVEQLRRARLAQTPTVPVEAAYGAQPAPAPPTANGYDAAAAAAEQERLERARAEMGGSL
jgi:hypothetical protein